MTTRKRLASFLLAALALTALASAACAQAASTPAPPPAPKTVTLDLRNVPLADAIRRVVAATDLSVVIAGPLPEEPRVTMRLRDTDPVLALQALATAGNLYFQAPQMMERGAGQGLWYNGPALISTEYPQGMGGPPRPQRPVPAAPPASAAAPLPATIAVDLDVKDVPLRVAVEQIAKQIPATDRLHIVVDESVPKDLRVTARFSKTPLNWVIESLVQQAGLTYGVQEEPDPQIAAALAEQFQSGTANWMNVQKQLAELPRLRTVYIVPKPELHVSGGGG
jgi:hypothetical protein